MSRCRSELDRPLYLDISALFTPVKPDQPEGAANHAFRLVPMMLWQFRLTPLRALAAGVGRHTRRSKGSIASDGVGDHRATLSLAISCSDMLMTLQQRSDRTVLSEAHESAFAFAKTA